MGQVADAAGNPNTFAPDPSGFNGSEWATRFMGGAATGALNGLNQRQNQINSQRPVQMTQPVPMPQQPQVQLPMGGPGTGDQSSTQAKNPYFFGYGQ